MIMKMENEKVGDGGAGPKLENMLNEGSGNSLSSALSIIRRMPVDISSRTFASILPKLGSYPHLLSAAGKIGKIIMAKSLARRYSENDGLKGRQYACSMFIDSITTKLPQLSSNCRERIADIIFNQRLNHGESIRKKYAMEFGQKPPALMVINPTYGCNLTCKGCYASEHSAQKKQMSPEKVNSLIKEGKEKMGIHFIVMSGGEPFFWNPMMDIVKDNKDVMFLIYTNGTLINDELAGKLAEAGNAYPAVSIEGSKESTDARRGKGIYEKVMAGMKRLKENGIFFGFSVTATKLNSNEILKEEFVDSMVEKGAGFGWYFQYLLLGKNPIPELVPTAEQRYKRLKDLKAMRKKGKPIFLADFWNDGELINGCLAFGRRYININAEGNVEPCAFLQYNTGNVYEQSLTEILNSDLYKEARLLQPFKDENGLDLRRPCPIIDHPEILRELLKNHPEIQASYPGAERAITGDLAHIVDKNNREYKNLLTIKDNQKVLEPV